MRKVIGIGETILDIIFRGNQPYVAVPGGSVFNGLVSLGRLGVDVLFISEIGNDKVGDIIQQFMQENHISTQYVDRFPDGKAHCRWHSWTSTRMRSIPSTKTIRNSDWKYRFHPSKKMIFSSSVPIIP